MSKYDLFSVVSLAYQAIENYGYANKDCANPTKQVVLNMLNQNKPLKQLCSQFNMDRAEKALDWILYVSLNDSFIKRMHDAVR